MKIKLSTMESQNLTFEKARNLSIIDMLEKNGHFPTRKSEKEAWFLSPFRIETQASFKVSINHNYWYDFAEGVGGNIIDLIIKLNSCSPLEALEKLSNSSFSFHEKTDTIINEKEYTIYKVKKLENVALLNYLNERKIDIKMAQKYCVEIHYLMKNKKYFSIGFKNDLNGWEIRNKYFKGSFGTKDITTIKNNSNSAVIFEGFFDMLSYLTIYPEQFKVEDLIVLNSLSLLKKVISKISNYSKIKTFLDNDIPGIKATECLITDLKLIEDCSVFYSEFKDLNEYLIKSKNLNE